MFITEKLLLIYFKDGICLPPGQNQTGCVGYDFYVPPSFNTCEYVLRTSEAPPPFMIEEWYLGPCPNECTVFRFNLIVSKVPSPALFRRVFRLDRACHGAGC